MKVRWFTLLVLLASVFGFMLLAHPSRTTAQSPFPLPNAPQQNVSSVGEPPANTENIEVVGHIGGTFNDLVVRGNFAYLAAGPRVQILDVSDPSAPTLLSQSLVLPNRIQDIALDGNYVYAANGEGGLHILDVSDLTNPVLLGSYSGLANTVAVNGSHAYVTADQLDVLDVSNPTQPIKVGSYNPNGRPSRIAVSGNYVYVTTGDSADNNRRLEVLSLANPTTPTQVGYYETLEPIGEFVIDGNYAYIKLTGWGRDPAYDLLVVNVTNPTQPSLVSYFKRYRNYSLAAAQGYVYITDGGLTVIDARDQSALGIVGVTREPPSGPEAKIVVSGNHAYIYTSRALYVLDVSNPTNLKWVGRLSTQGTAMDVALTESHVYVADGDEGLTIVDISNVTSPTAVAEFDTSDVAYAVSLSDTYAYVADGEGGLRILDVSDPSTPYEVAFYDTAGTAQAITLVGIYAYVADGEGGMLTLDVSNPRLPQFVSIHTGPALDVAVVGSHAYLATRGGLRVLDISDPTKPLWLSFFDTPSEALAVTVVDQYAYVAANAAGLRIIDVSNPSTPIEVGAYDTPGFVRDVEVVENRVYLAEGNGYIPWQHAEGALYILDVSDPATPQYLGGYIELAGALGVAVSETYAYVADGGTRYQSSLRIFDVASPPSIPQIGHYRTVSYVGNANVFENRVYVPLGSLYILDVNNPSTPKVVGSSPLDVTDVAVSGNYAYIVDGYYGSSGVFRVLDISDPANLSEVGSYTQSGRKIAVYRNYVYILDSTYMHIFDVSNPTIPVKISSYQITSNLEDIAVVENIAYVTTQDSLYVLDVSDPTAPKQISRYFGLSCYYFRNNIAVSSGYVYIACGAFDNDNNGLHIIDVSNPETPFLAGAYATDADALDVAVSGNYAYLTTKVGLHVLDVAYSALPIQVGFFRTPENSWPRIETNSDYIYLGSGTNGLYMLQYTGEPASRFWSYLPLLNKR
jgi:hypothetical protein